MFNKTFTVLLALILTVPLLLFAQGVRKPERLLTGMFTDMRYNEEAGDLLGMEVYLVYGDHGYFASIQCAGGEPAKPVVVPVKISGNRLSFRLPEGQPECGTAFTGVITSQGLKGRFEGEEKDRWLARKKGYWQ